MNFSLDKFLKPLADSDRNVQIYNNSDVVQYTINPFSVTRLNISNNLLKVNLNIFLYFVLKYLHHLEVEQNLPHLL